MNEYIVYQHISPSHKKYIGMTGQTPNQRWRNGNGYKSCTAFQNAINKYGWDNFQHKILHDKLTFEEAKELEKFYINLYQTYKKEFGYNIKLGGEGKQIPFEDIENLFIQGLSIIEIAKKLGFNRNTISKYLKDLGVPQNVIHERTKNYIHKKTTDKWTSIILSLWESGNTQQEIHQKTHCNILTIRTILQENGITKSIRYTEAAKKRNARCRKPVIQYDLNLKIINEYTSVTQAQEKTGIDKGSICKCCKGKIKTAGGYKWQYKITEEIK